MAKTKQQRELDRLSAIDSLKNLVTPYTTIVAFQHKNRSNSKGQLIFSFLVSETVENNICRTVEKGTGKVSRIRNITDHILCLFSEKKRYRWFYRTSEPHEIMYVLAKSIFTEEEIQNAGFENLAHWAGSMMERIY